MKLILNALELVALMERLPSYLAEYQQHRSLDSLRPIFCEQLSADIREKVCTITRSLLKTSILENKFGKVS